jgi:transposase InsO family protein
LIGKRLQKRLTSCFYRPTNVVLRRPLESTQYTSEQFQRLMADHGVVCSMSRRSGNVWDNAAMELLLVVEDRADCAQNVPNEGRRQGRRLRLY